MSHPRAVFRGVEVEQVDHVEVHERPAVPGVASAQGAHDLEGRVGIVQVRVFCLPGANPVEIPRGAEGRLSVSAPNADGEWVTLELEPATFKSAVPRWFGREKKLTEFAFGGAYVKDT